MTKLPSVHVAGALVVAGCRFAMGSISSGVWQRMWPKACDDGDFMAVDHAIPANIFDPNSEK